LSSERAIIRENISQLKLEFQRFYVVASTDAYALSRSDLNGFLFAEIGVEASGMTLSVLSTFARLGMDPWQEAGRLATLPRTAAVDGLARIIAAMPASLWSLPDATAIAARLVALLPARGGGGPSIAPSTGPAPGAPRTIRQWVVMLALLAAVLAGLASNLVGQRGIASHSDAAHGSASHAAAAAMAPAGHTTAGEVPRG
jgi:hypothetical protein